MRALRVARMTISSVPDAIMCGQCAGRRRQTTRPCRGLDSRQVLVFFDGEPFGGARRVRSGGVLQLDRESMLRLNRIEVW